MGVDCARITALPSVGYVAGSALAPPPARSDPSRAARLGGALPHLRSMWIRPRSCSAASPLRCCDRRGRALSKRSRRPVLLGLGAWRTLERNSQAAHRHYQSRAAPAPLAPRPSSVVPAQLTHAQSRPARQVGYRGREMSRQAMSCAISRFARKRARSITLVWRGPPRYGAIIKRPVRCSSPRATMPRSSGC